MMIGLEGEARQKLQSELCICHAVCVDAQVYANTIAAFESLFNDSWRS